MRLQLVSLSEMLEIYAEAFFKLGALVRHMQDRAVTIWAHQAYDAENLKGVLNWIRECEQLCLRAEMNTSAGVLMLTRVEYEKYPPTYGGAAMDFKNIQKAVQTELMNRWLLYLPDRLAQLYKVGPSPFGDAAWARFPSARTDILEACKCLALDRNTAAVFHLMRAVEWGLRALCAHVGFRQLRSQKKSGKIVYRPVAYSQWEAILNQLQARVDARLEKIKRGSRKQAEQEFYYPLLQDISGIREAWRNHTMHTRSEYRADQATVILGHVHRLMMALASRVSEV